MQNSVIESISQKPYLQTNYTKSYKEVIVIRQVGKVLFIPVDDIISLQAQGNYTLVKLQDTSILVSHTLKQIIAQLDPQIFLRVHNSHCINSYEIREIRKSEDSIILSDNSIIPYSRKYKYRIIDYINSFTS